MQTVPTYAMRQLTSRSGVGRRATQTWFAQVNKTRGLSRSFNHTLKYVFKGAALQKST
jgi:hypothetical protein